ncbi:MAG: class I SAM-dependent methyltransferase [Gammaproteobacteria bacterium]|nr:class I SAM-dependent methyltransferase [Gammaproteobacteria bacterium]
MQNKPYAESCDQNRDVILSVIKPLLALSYSVLEIGSGTGQHALYFSHKLPHLTWQTSDRNENIGGIKLWLSDSAQTLPEPIELDVNNNPWPDIDCDAVFTANTCHIMNQDSVVAMFSGIGKLLSDGGQFIIYGPFNYNQRYTSQSNEHFDQWLKSRDPESGIKHFEELNHLAALSNMHLTNDFEMPANNRILHWVKRGD